MIVHNSSVHVNLCSAYEKDILYDNVTYNPMYLL